MGRRAIQINRRMVGTNRRARGRSGGPPPCCCGTPTCNCNTNAGCSTFPTKMVVGSHVPIPPGSPPTWNFTIPPTPVTCCCGPRVGQKFRRYQRTRFTCLEGPCAGATQFLAEFWWEWDGLSNLLRYRTRQAVTLPTAQGPCCGATVVNEESNVSTPAPSGGCWPWPGHGLDSLNDLSAPSTEAYVSPGRFIFSCNVHEYDLAIRYSTGGLGLRLEETHIRSYIFPNNEVCVGPECLKTCCLPNGGCLEIPESACLALGGLPQPDRHCFTAGCEGNAQKGACCIRDTGGCVISTLAGCLAPNIFRGLGTNCIDDIGCPQPTGRCCVPAGGGGYTCSGGLTSIECAALNGVWGGYNSTCASLPCPGPAGGACCLPGGGCTQVNNPQACIDLNGTFFSGGDCQAVQCTGSCCTNGVCSMATQQGCILGGGTFVGGLSCNPDPCNVVGACCNRGAHGGQLNCSVLTQQACLQLNEGVWLGPGTSCEPFPCGGGTTEAPFLAASHFARGFHKPFVSPIVLRDGTPASSIGKIVGGCAGCGEGQKRTQA